MLLAPDIREWLPKDHLAYFVGDLVALFRKKHLSAFKQLFLQILKLAKEGGLLKLGVIAIDGTKMKANASRHKALSYGRMDEAEKRLKKRVDDILEEAEDIDLAEDDLYGEDSRGDELPAELADPIKRIKKIKELKEKIKKDEKEKTADQNAKPKDKEQRSLTDYDSRIMKTANGSFHYADNCQTAVCGDPRKGEVQIIVAAKLTNRPCDVTELIDVLEIAEENTGQKPKTLVADAGYYSNDNLKYCADQDISAFVPPNRQKHCEFMQPAPKGRIPVDATTADRMRRKLRTKAGKEIYGARKVMNEPIYGQQKGVRGIRQFLLRGIDNVESEWNFICATGNILKLFRYANLENIGWNGKERTI